MSSPLVSFDDAQEGEHMACAAIKRPTLGFAPCDQCIDVNQNLLYRVTFGDEVIEAGGAALLTFPESVVQVVPIGSNRAHLGPSLRGEPREDDSAEKPWMASGKFLHTLVVFVGNRHWVVSCVVGFHASPLSAC